MSSRLSVCLGSTARSAARGRCVGFTAASSRLRELFSNAVPTDLDEGLKRTVAWPELAQLVRSGIVVDAAEGLVEVVGAAGRRR